MDDSKKIILLIDDDDDYRQIVALKFEKSGFQVEQADSGKSGIEMISKIKPDLIILDVQMPDMSGPETLAKIKSDPDLANTKVLFLTNYGEIKEENSWIDDKFAKEAGALGHIRKTDDLDKILDRVRQAIS